ncbi:oxygenase MpaB family protein [Dermacoccaceae bacterium W4C1]
MNPLHAGRRRIGEAVRAKVAGPDAGPARARIWDTPGERWFTDADPIWRVHSDASMFVGGVAALLLQSLHPSAMAGVAGHSGYRSDPWGRLQRTSHYIATTTFGTIEHAEEAIAVVAAVHRRVRGRTPDGIPYAASDPHLLRWVHVAEIDSFLRAHQNFGTTALTDTEADTYVAQTTLAAHRLGATDLPTTRAELTEVVESYRPELHAGPAAVDTATFLLREPPLPAAAKPGYALLARGALHLLPDWALAEMTLNSPVAARLSGQVATTVIRSGLRAVG